MGAVRLRRSGLRVTTAVLLGGLCCVGVAQAAPAAVEQPSRSSALPRQIWAVAYAADDAARLKPRTLAALRKRGINALVAPQLTKAQRARLRRKNRQAKLALVEPLRAATCRGVDRRHVRTRGRLDSVREGARPASRSRPRRGHRVRAGRAQGAAAPGRPILALVKLTRRHLDRAAWTLAVERAANNPAAHLGVMPVGKAGRAGARVVPRRARTRTLGRHAASLAAPTSTADASSSNSSSTSASTSASASACSSPAGTPSPAAASTTSTATTHVQRGAVLERSHDPDCDGVRARRTAVRDREGRPAPRDQRDRLARPVAVRDARRRPERRAWAARRRVRPGLRRQPLRLRLLDELRPTTDEPDQPLHRERRSTRTGPSRARSY